jgi:Fe2+ or Zn2+ uptake regulation protein
MSTYERAVFGLLLEHHPALLSIEEVVRHVAPSAADFAERDAVHVAIRALVQAGLVHRLDRFVFAAGPAVYLERLGPP